MMLSFIPASWQYKILNKVSRSATGAGTHFALVKGWKAFTKKDPPLNPVSPTTSWAESIVWGVLAGAVIGGVGAITRRLTAEEWQKYIGPIPEEPNF